MSEERDQQKWEAVLLGKQLPRRSDSIEMKAYKVRQALLWNKAVRDTHEQVSYQGAAYIYANAYKKIRKQKYLLIGLLFLLIMAFSLALYFFISEPEKTNKALGNVVVNSSSDGVNADLPNMIVILSGSFDRGCSAGWDDKVAGCSESEKPVKTLNVENFALSRFEVTVNQFRRFVSETNYITTAEKNADGCILQDKEGKWVVSRTHSWKNPGFEQTDQHPVVCISWIDTQSYIAWLSKLTGKTYRLPTETEWEYAARGGKANPFYWGDQPDHRYANYLGVEGEDRWAFTAPVGLTTGNDFGLHDMSGNAWEWVEDCWRKDYNSECENEDIRVRRGGGWDNLPKSIRSAYRSKGHKSDRSYLYGFRVAHDLE